MPVECYQPCPCDDFYKCPIIWNPVCGIDGITYHSICKAEDMDIACEGYCPCKCPSGPPVCTIKNITYQSFCDAEKANETVDCYGPCPCQCGGCGLEGPDLKCGTDHITYLNQCEADCNYAKIKCDGVCPCELLKGIFNY